MLRRCAPAVTRRHDTGALHMIGSGKIDSHRVRDIVLDKWIPLTIVCPVRSTTRDP
jgi:hypothetical protein